MKITIATRLNAGDINLIKKIIAKSDFHTLGNYFTYLIYHLTSNNLINPITRAKSLIYQRKVHALLNFQAHKLVLTITDKSLTKKYLEDLQLELETNSYWDLSRLWDYALCQILINSNETFSFNLTNDDKLLIDNVNNKVKLQKLQTMA